MRRGSPLGGWFGVGQARKWELDRIYCCYVLFTDLLTFEVDESLGNRGLN